ncbi:MAG TPA: tetratricopeptide repeat protein [Blastocatellia bacterium]|nr:tetratricopeptide repeat protein [Blastocatellia bacterium]
MKPLLSLLAFCLLAGGAAAANGFGQKPTASAEQETEMFGRLLGAVQDVGGGFYGEAMSRFSRIIPEMEKRNYRPRPRWLAYDTYARALIGKGDPQAAIKALKVAIEEAKQLTAVELVKSTSRLADIYDHTGNLAEAIEEYKTALAADPKNHQVMLDLGSVYRRSKRFAEARELYDRVLAGDPANANAHMNLGNLYGDQGNLDAAVAEFEKHAALSDDRELAARNFLNAGFRYYDRGDYERALALYNRALQLTPDNALAFTDIGWATLALGRTQEAIAAFEKALKLKPAKDVKEYAGRGLKEARSKKP